MPDENELYEALSDVKMGTDVALDFLQKAPHRNQLRDIESIVIVLEDCLTRLGVLKNQFTEVDLENDVSSSVFQALEETHVHTNNRLAGLRDRIDIVQSQQFQVSTCHNGRRGRPCFDISAESLQSYRDLGFSWTSIGQLLG